MQINVINCSKLFNNQTVLNNLNFTLKENTKTAILGDNGSGKSTLCLLLASQLIPTFGKIQHTNKNVLINAGSIFKYIAFSSPAMQLPLELNLIELLKLQNSIKPLTISNNEFFDLCNFNTKTTKKALYSFSSGMIQRVKLILNFCNTQPLIIADEPTENLDTKGCELYTYLVKNFTENKTIVIATNRNMDIENTYDILNLNSISK